jgi:hypothetical protein
MEGDSVELMELEGSVEFLCLFWFVVHPVMYCL